MLSETETPFVLAFNGNNGENKTNNTKCGDLNEGSNNFGSSMGDHTSIYNPFQCLSVMVGKSFTGNCNHSPTVSSVTIGSINPDHVNNSNIGSNSNMSTIISSNNTFTNYGHLIQNPQPFAKRMYPPICSTLSSSSPSMSPLSSPCTYTSSRRITISHDFLSSDNSFSHETSVPASEIQCLDLSSSEVACRQAQSGNQRKHVEEITNFLSFGTKNVLPCSFDQDRLMTWAEQHPKSWSKSEVLDWVFFVAEEQGLDMQEFKAENFQGHTGAQLYHMTLEDFTRLEPRCGATLYRMFRKVLPGEQYQHGTHPGQYPRTTFIQDSCCLSEVSTTSLSEHLPRRRPCQRKVKGHIDIGRESKAKKVTNQHLWEFIYQTLMDPRYNPRYLKWESQPDGIFRFVQSKAVAKLWGRRKNNENMTYEKLGRAMRYYYRRGILERVEGRRLVYKFSFNTMEKAQEKKN